MAPITHHLAPVMITFAGEGMGAGQSQWVTFRDKRLREGTVSITARALPKLVTVAAVQTGDIFTYTEPVILPGGVEREVSAGVMVTNPGPARIAQLIVEISVHRR